LRPLFEAHARTHASTLVAKMRVRLIGMLLLGRMDVNTRAGHGSGRGDFPLLALAARLHQAPRQGPQGEKVGLLLSDDLQRRAEAGRHEGGTNSTAAENHSTHTKNTVS
jgi:hypothetical protein